MLPQLEKRAKGIRHKIIEMAYKTGRFIKILVTE